MQTPTHFWNDGEAVPAKNYLTTDSYSMCEYESPAEDAAEGDEETIPKSMSQRAGGNY